MTQSHVLKNHFLVAMPKLNDFNFSKSVVYIFEHDDQGALGMIINKPLQINLGAVLAHLNISTAPPEITQQPVLMGGPVGQEHGFIIFAEPRQKARKADVLVSASKAILCDI